MIYNAWRTLTGTEEDTCELRSFLQLASKEGGGGLTNAEDTIKAAYIAGCLEAAKHVKENVGKSHIEKEEFRDAVKSLKDKYDIDLWKVIQSEPERAGGRRWKKLQKTIMDKVMVKNNEKRKAALGPERRAIASAAEQKNSPGANDWLTARPRGRRQAFADDEYALLVRWRFRLPLTEGD